jgi:hypothetical protein
VSRSWRLRSRRRVGPRQEPPQVGEQSTRRQRPRSSPSSPRAASTASTRSTASPPCSASCRIGPTTAISSSHRKAGPPPARCSMTPSSSSRSATSPSGLPRTPESRRPRPRWARGAVRARLPIIRMGRIPAWPIGHVAAVSAVGRAFRSLWTLQPDSNTLPEPEKRREAESESARSCSARHYNDELAHDLACARRRGRHLWRRRRRPLSTRVAPHGHVGAAPRGLLVARGCAPGRTAVPMSPGLWSSTTVRRGTPFNGSACPCP